MLYICQHIVGWPLSIRKMLPKLKVSIFLLKRLERVKLQCSGCLYGIVYGEGTLLLLSFNIEPTIGKRSYEQIEHNFPAEIDLCGLVKFGDCADGLLSEVLSSVDITDNPIVLQCQLGTLVGLRASFFVHGKLEEVPYEVMEAPQLYNDFCFARLKCGLNIKTSWTKEDLMQEMHVLRKNVADGGLVFNIQNTKVYVNCSGPQSKNISNESLIEHLLQALPNLIPNDIQRDSNSMVRVSQQSIALGCGYDVINIDVFRCRTRDPVARDAPPHPSLNICIKNEEQGKVVVPMEVDTMAILCKKTKFCRLYDILIESICRALRLFEQSLTESLLENDTNRLPVPRSYHFYPHEFGHFLTCCYLDNCSDDEPHMQEKRKQLHRQLALPVTRPYFRRANQCRFNYDISIWTPLMNPHIGLRPSGVADGKKYLVNGNYYYYHYLQQQVLDKGWGCAYRSIQTICSWFMLQGYTTTNITAVPTHLEIQQYLHKINDKAFSFVGSTQWIGSTEVSMCLQGLLNVESKIVHVASGTDLGTIAPELATHFQTQGTPVMIGGGVLAHTIIGVDFCVQTGDVKFLILDPHYVGTDDLAIIQGKGWCGWKNVDFWDKKSYYNICLPQRPILY